MKAFKQGITKEAFVAEIAIHKKLDHFLQGTYQEGDKGCAVGCSIMSINKLTKKDIATSSHKSYETYLGIPEWLAYLEDKLFEEMTVARSKEWPLEFIEAINVGSDLDKIKVPFLCFLLEQNVATMTKLLESVEDKKQIKIVEGARDCNKQMIAALLSEDKDKIEEARKVAYAANATAYTSAYYAANAATNTAGAYYAANAAYAADSNAAANAANAAYAAVGSNTAYAVINAAASTFATYFADAASGGDIVYVATAYTNTELYADKLLELMRECK